MVCVCVCVCVWVGGCVGVYVCVCVCVMSSPAVDDHRSSCPLATLCNDCIHQSDHHVRMMGHSICRPHHHLKLDSSVCLLSLKGTKYD